MEGSDKMDYDKMLKDLTEVRHAIQHLDQFVPTEYNCTQILGCIQRLNRCVDALNARIKEVGQNE